MDFGSLSARELAYHIRIGAVDPVELVKYHFKQIHSHNSKLNALCHFNEEAALRLAQERSQQVKKGDIRGRLHGVCFCAKDSIDVAGFPRGDGSKNGTINNNVQNAAIVQKLLDEGAICIGKSNMAEYGKSYYTENPVFGRTNNPFDHARSPGGSGGGDAAALASNFAKFALGVDSGGSIRVPANYCGLFGLYPTRGLISSAGISLYNHTIGQLFRCHGLLTKTLEDMLLLLSIVSGYDARDPASVPPLFDTTNARCKGKFGYFVELNGVRCDPQIETALRAAVKTLEQAGLRGEEFAPPSISAAYEIFIILAGQAALMIEDILAEESGNPRNRSEEGALVQTLRKRIATELPPLSADMLLKAWYRVDKLRFEMIREFERSDFFLSPVTAILPPTHGTTKYTLHAKDFQSQQIFQFASAINVLGLPAIAFPTNKSTEGLPVGLQITGPRFSERFLLSKLSQAGFTTSIKPGC